MIERETGYDDYYDCDGPDSADCGRDDGPLYRMSCGHFDYEGNETVRNGETICSECAYQEWAERDSRERAEARGTSYCSRCGDLLSEDTGQFRMCELCEEILKHGPRAVLQRIA